jgi:adenylosuccinate lyase
LVTRGYRTPSMIDRYARPETARIFSDEEKYAIWLEIETLAAEKMAALGQVPESVPKALRTKGRFDAGRIAEIEAEVKHDVIAFLTNLGESLGPEARYVHQGLTSSDILDTTFAVQLTRTADLLSAALDRLLAALADKARAHAETVCMGRSHGVHAEPTTFGVKLAGHHAAFARAKSRLAAAKKEVGTCALSGAVGTYATVDPEVEQYVAGKLGLVPETVSTQVVPRDRHAAFFATLAVIAGSVETLATEIRHLQRTEVREVEEPFTPGQKGSSAMPHKRNPILTENLTGLARIVRAAALPALENIALWHERDISHSSVERTVLPDACIALDFALHRLAGVLENLQVYPDAMKANLNRQGGLHFSQRVMLALTQKGASREEAYRLVQVQAMKVWEDRAGGGTLTLLDALSADPGIMKYLPQGDLVGLFDVGAYTRHCPMIVERALGGA